MKKLYLVGATLLTGVIIAGAMSASVLAWHPEGKIKKYVQNQTSNSALSDANTAQDAVSAQPGDTLTYVIEVSNTGKRDSKGWNDMHYTVLKDTLPAGVELVSNPAQRQITENLGVIKPGQKVTKTYQVRVTSTTNQDAITNEACFTGDSEVRDNKQAGCDPAVVTVTVPEDPEEPEEPTVPQTSSTSTTKPQVLPAKLPSTGPASMVAAFTGTTGLGYAIHRLLGRRK